MARANQHWSATQSEAMLGGREVQQPPTHLSSPNLVKVWGAAFSLLFQDEKSRGKAKKLDWWGEKGESANKIRLIFLQTKFVIYCWYNIITNYYLVIVL